MDLSPSLTATLAVAALAVAAVAAAVAVAAQQRLARVRRQYHALTAGGRADVASVLADQDATIARLRAEVAAVRGDLDAVRGDIAQSLRHVAVVRYDAFGDMGGRLSFSAALVDDRGDGLVLSSISARGESRTYGKGVVHGASDVTLTPEEQQALAAARDDRAVQGARR
jgi:hypothetical protein